MHKELCAQLDSQIVGAHKMLSWICLFVLKSTRQKNIHGLNYNIYMIGIISHCQNVINCMMSTSASIECYVTYTT